MKVGKDTIRLVVRTHFISFLVSFSSMSRKMAAQNLTNQIRRNDLPKFLLVTMTTNKLNRLSLVVSKDGERRIPRETTEIIRGEEGAGEMGIEIGRLCFAMRFLKLDYWNDFHDCSGLMITSLLQVVNRLANRLKLIVKTFYIHKLDASCFKNCSNKSHL